MKCFLTSLACLDESNVLNSSNSFADELKSSLETRIRGVFIASMPDWNVIIDDYAQTLKEAIEGVGVRFDSYAVLDGRNADQAESLVSNADLIILSGGHVPTQNKFFEEIELRRIVAGFDGVALGISAGSMNCADVVYSPPELDGEAIDPEYRRFLTGLNLTKTMLVPHYSQMINLAIDDMDFLKDILIPDSVGKRFYGIVDGSYLYIHDDKEELCGESYLIENRKVRRLASDGERFAL